MYFILFYDYVDGILDKRQPYREGHLALLGEFVSRGELVMGGAFADPVDGAALVFKVDDRSRVEAFMADDPYLANGLVTDWRIRPWSVVVGSYTS
jgi:hypothetical protein